MADALAQSVGATGHRARVACAALGAYAFIGGAVTLFGWAAGHARLMDWGASGITMKANTAIAAMLAGAALVLMGLRAGPRALVRALAVVAALIGGATLSQHVFGWNLGIDTLLFAESAGARATAAPGRMGPLASGSYVLLGSGLILATLGGRARTIAAGLGITVAGVVVLPLLGYLFGADPLYSLPRSTGIAPQTTTLLAALGLGLALAVPERGLFAMLQRDDPGGSLLRRLLLPVLVLPMVLCWLVLRGREAGLYDAPFGAVMFAMVMTAMLAGLIWMAARHASRTNAALWESERALRVVADSVPVLIWTSGLDAARSYFNRQWLEFTGQAPGQPLDGGWIETVHPEDRDGYRAAYEGSFARREPFAAGYRLRRADGQYRSVAESAVPRYAAGGEFLGYIGSCVDVTDRKTADEARAMLAAIVRASDDAIVSKSLDGVIRSWNAGAERVFGYTSAEAVGRSIDLIIPPDLRDQERSILDRLRRGERIEHFETVRATKDGRRIDISLTVSPVRDESGRVIGASKVARDITDRKQLERERAGRAAELTQALARRTDEVTRAEKALAHAQRMAAVGTLASGLAHDINNVLLAFSGRIDTVLGDPRLAPDTRADLSVIVALLDHLRQMSRNLSLFARDPNREGIEGRTDLGPWAQSVKSLFERSLVPGPGLATGWIKMAWDLPDYLPPVGIAPHRLTQVVLNLVHNARDAVLAKAGPDHGGSMAGTITIQARTEPEGGGVSLRVVDDGCGMDDEVRRRSVEPFFTTRDRPDAPGGAGTGLGLSLAVETVRRAGGQVQIDSQVGKGTTITMTLPIADR